MSNKLVSSLIPMQTWLESRNAKLSENTQQSENWTEVILAKRWLAQTPEKYLWSEFLYDRLIFSLISGDTPNEFVRLTQNFGKCYFHVKATKKAFSPSCLLEDFLWNKRSMFVICDWWISISFSLLLNFRVRSRVFEKQYKVLPLWL